MHRSLKFIVLALTALLDLPSIASTCIDPDTGGMLFQTLSTALAP